MANNTLRTKTIEALTVQAEKIGMKAEELIQKVATGCDDFCELTEEEARRYLLLLKITPPKKVEEPAEEAFDETVETAENPKTDTNSKRDRLTLEKVLEDGELLEIGIENAIKVYGDLAAAYKAAHPKCWLTKKDEYPEDLRKALLDDATILYVIRDKCKRAADSKNAEEIERILYLTSSDTEKYRFGGLKSLGFGHNLSMYVKNHAKLIGDYFNTFLKDRKPINGLPIPKGVEFPKEATVAPKKVSKDGSKDAPAEAPTEADQPIGNKDAINLPNAEEPIAIPLKPAKKLDTQKVINRLGDVRSFLYLADKLRKIGIDPEALLEKEDGVKAMIKKVVKAMDEI